MKITAGATALPPSLQQPRKRRSNRRETKRRASTNRPQINSDAHQQGLWMDALEEVTHVTEDVVDEEYDELKELEEEDEKKPKKKQRSSRARKKNTAGVLPSRLQPRTLGSILMEESQRPDTTAVSFLNASATTDRILPRRKFCPVTGLMAKYRDPKSNIPYASLRALEQIQERAPPWYLLTDHGAPTFAETAQILLENKTDATPPVSEGDKYTEGV